MRAIALAVLLSVTSTFGLMSWHNSLATDYSTLRQSTHFVTNGPSSCSGVAIAPNTVLTAAHCLVDDKQPIRVDGYNFEIVKVDAKRDLMLLKGRVEGPYVPVASGMPPVDTKAYAVGYPLAERQYHPQWLTEGRIGEVQTHEALFGTFAVTTPGIFGNSGGPIFAFVEGGWKVAGIYSRISGGAIMGMFPMIVYHMGFAVHSDSINEFLK